MVTAVVLINVERAEIKRVVEALLDVDGVTEVYTVAGEYDLVAIIRVKDNERLSKIVAEELTHDFPGITRAKTLFALGVHSKYDLKGFFGL